MGTASRGGDAFTDLGSNEVKFAKKELLMMPPEEKLKHFTNRAQDSEDNQQVGISLKLSLFGLVFRLLWIKQYQQHQL